MLTFSLSRPVKTGRYVADVNFEVNSQQKLFSPWKDCLRFRKFSHNTDKFIQKKMHIIIIIRRRRRRRNIFVLEDHFIKLLSVAKESFLLREQEQCEENVLTVSFFYFRKTMRFQIFVKGSSWSIVCSWENWKKVWCNQGHLKNQWEAAKTKNNCFDTNLTNIQNKNNRTS